MIISFTFTLCLCSFFCYRIPLTISVLLLHPLPVWGRAAASDLPCLGIAICGPRVSLAHLHWLWGPHGRGLVGVRLLGLRVRSHLLGYLPGIVLVLLAVLVVIHACGHICLPVEQTRNVRHASYMTRLSERP